MEHRESPLPCFDAEAERAVLATILLDGEPALRAAREGLRGEDFYLPAHTAIFEAMTRLAERGDPIDPITLRAELGLHGLLDRAGGDAHLMHLTELIPPGAEVEPYAAIVRRHATMRRLRESCLRLAAEAAAPVVDLESFLEDARRELSGLLREDGRRTRMAARAPRRLRQLERGRGRAEPSGLYALDRLTDGGLRAGELVVIFGGEGLGKSALLSSIALSFAARGKPAGVWVAEGEAAGFTDRALAALASVPATRDLGGVREEEWGRLAAASAELARLPISLFERETEDRGGLRRDAIEARHAASLDLALIDDAHLLSPDLRGEASSAASNAASSTASSSARATRALLRALRGLARELRVPVVAALDGGPAGALGKGALEAAQEASDLVLTLRPAKGGKRRAGCEEMELVPHKRGGSAAAEGLLFERAYARFESLDPSEFADDERWSN